MTQEMLISLAPTRVSISITETESDGGERRLLTLGDHLQVDIVLSKGGEHPAGNTNHVLHLSPDQTQDGHVGENGDLSTICEILPSLGKGLYLGACGVNGHGNVHLGRGNEIDRDGMRVENGKDTGKEAMGDGSLVGVDVDDADVVLDGDGSRSLGLLESRLGTRGRR